MQEQNSKECSIIAYYFSKFDEKALGTLGYSSYSAAFKALGELFDKKPSYIKLKRDEFDAIVSSVRQGFHKRSPAKDVWELHCELKALSFDELTKKVNTVIEKQKISSSSINNTSERKTSSLSVGEISNDTGEKKKRNNISGTIPCVSDFFGANLSKIKGNIYDVNGRTISVTISKSYPRKNGTEYWYSIYPSQREALSGQENAQIVFTFSDIADTLIVLNYKNLETYYPELEKTEKQDGYVHYHIRFLNTNGAWFFLTTKGKYDISTTNGFVLSKMDEAKPQCSEQSESNRTRIKITSSNFHEIPVKKKKR